MTRAGRMKGIPRPDGVPKDAHSAMGGLGGSDACQRMMKLAPNTPEACTYCVGWLAWKNSSSTACILGMAC